MCWQRNWFILSTARTPLHYLLRIAFDEMLLFNLLDLSVSKPYRLLMLNFRASFLTKLTWAAAFLSLYFTLPHHGSQGISDFCSWERKSTMGSSHQRMRGKSFPRWEGPRVYTQCMTGTGEQMFWSSCHVHYVGTTNMAPDGQDDGVPVSGWL